MLHREPLQFQIAHFTVSAIYEMDLDFVMIYSDQLIALISNSRPNYKMQHPYREN